MCQLISDLNFSRVLHSAALASPESSLKIKQLRIALTQSATALCNYDTEGVRNV
jgi:hypothetical protein